MKISPEEYKLRLHALIRDIASDYEDDRTFRYIAGDAFETLYRFLGCEMKIVYRNEERK